MSNILDKIRSYIWSFIKLILAVGLVAYIALYFIKNDLWWEINHSIGNLFSDTNTATQSIRKDATEISKDVKGVVKQ